MAAQREVFRVGAGANGLTLEKADEVFDLMEKFAGYGFNKSHSAAYALLAYHTACARGTDVDKPRNLAKSVTVE